jgi:uncharacterized protein YjiS (DUF1127 family)
MIMTVLNQWTLEQILLAACGSVTLLLVCSQILLQVRCSRLEKRLSAMLQGSRGHDLETMLVEHRNTLNQLNVEHQEIRDAVKNFERLSDRNLRRLGLVRYDAFKETNGNLSYSLAVLNDAGSGFVITGIFTQEQSRTYVKAVRSWGQAENVLSEEELKAIKLAYKDNGSILH